MYARVTLLEFDPVRFGLDETLERFRSMVLPELRALEGFEGVFVLANDDARGLVMTLWASQEAADEAVRSGVWAAQTDRFVTLYAAAPGRQGYDVVLTDVLALTPD